MSVADTRASILLSGESGTGKTRLAQTIHQLSSRREGPFVVVNCGSLPAQLLGEKRRASSSLLARSRERAVHGRITPPGCRFAHGRRPLPIGLAAPLGVTDGSVGLCRSSSRLGTRG